MVSAMEPGAESALEGTMTQRAAGQRDPHAVPEPRGAPERRFTVKCPWCGADLTDSLRPEFRVALVRYLAVALVFLALGVLWGSWLF